MVTAIAEDLAELLSDIGEDVQLVDVAGSPTIQGIFRQPVARKPVGNIEGELKTPHLFVREADVVDVQKRQQVTVRAANWRVLDVLPDGEGFARVAIVKDSDHPDGVYR